jgi:uncharacterized protein (DUF2236 family)
MSQQPRLNRIENCCCRPPRLARVVEGGWIELSVPLLPDAPATEIVQVERAESRERRRRQFGTSLRNMDRFWAFVDHTFQKNAVRSAAIALRSHLPFVAPAGLGTTEAQTVRDPLLYTPCQFHDTLQCG